MARETKQKLLDAGIYHLAENGYKAASIRAFEKNAGVPHGSLRHHFGNLETYYKELTHQILQEDMPAPNADLPSVLHNWLTHRKMVTKARYELTILGINDSAIGNLIIEGRDKYVEIVASTGISTERARLIVAALDGVVLDGLLRGDQGADIEPVLSLLNLQASKKQSGS